MNVWAPAREWEGQDAFLIGGGPSLTDFDFSQLHGRNTIGCNDAFHLGPEVVQICLFGDANYFFRNHGEMKNFHNRVVTNAPSLLNYNTPHYVLKMRRERDGIHSGDTLGWNYSTGALAINLAIILGASRIFLLGYDCRNNAGKSHYHDFNRKLTEQSSFDRFQRGFKTVEKELPAGVRVLNVTNGESELQAFPRISFANFQLELAQPVPILEEA